MTTKIQVFGGNVAIGTSDTGGKKLKVSGGTTYTTGIVRATGLDVGSATNVHVPSGLIIMWSGATIPNGWYLCDGTNGTPNLQARFVAGVHPNSPSVPFRTVKGTRGASSYELSLGEMPKHAHPVSNIGQNPSPGVHNHNLTVARSPFGNNFGGIQGSNLYDPSYGSTYAWESSADSHQHTVEIDPLGSGDPYPVMPPYRVIKYIMKA